MTKRLVKVVVGDAVAVGFAVAGTLLLAVALHLGVNPADGSVVDASVRGTWVPVFLFFAALPAMALMFLTGGGVIGLPLMIAAQALTWWALGKAVSWASSALFR